MADAKEKKDDKSDDKNKSPEEKLRFNWTEQAAVLLLSLGEDAAAQVLS